MQNTNWHAALAAGLLSMGTAINLDWKAFKAFKSLDELAEYSWKLAAFRWAQGFITGFVPVLVGTNIPGFN